MTHCPQCGANVRPTARFCARCGGPLAAVAPTQAGPPVAKPVASLPHIQVEPTPTLPGMPVSSRSEQALFGFRFDTLPDWLNTPDVMGQSDTDKLAWALRNWQQFIANLWKWKGGAVALRFVSRPDRGDLEATLLGRVRMPSQTHQVAQAFAADLSSQLAALHLTPQPIVDSGTLAAIRRPTPLHCLLEIRQREDLVHLNLGDAYVVYPLRAPAGDFRLVFETLLRASQPTLLSLYLEPTELTRLEHETLTQAAATAQSLADFNYSGQYYQGRWQDPQAALVGEVYSELIRRLGQPFLCAAHVAGSNVPGTWAVARALENGLAVEPPGGSASPRHVPVQCDVLQARDPHQIQLAQAAITDLALHRWGESQATPGKERLCYLTDAAGAASLVRFPIVSRGGAPGLRVKQVAPGYDQESNVPRQPRMKLAWARF